jgi:hypothetical protein
MCTPGGDLSPLELADVNRDGLRDVLLTFVTTRNGTEGGKSSILWRLPREKESIGQLPRVSAQEGLQGKGFLYRSALHSTPHQNGPHVNPDHFKIKDHSKKSGPSVIVHMHAQTLSLSLSLSHTSLISSL